MFKGAFFDLGCQYAICFTSNDGTISKCARTITPQYQIPTLAERHMMKRTIIWWVRKHVAEKQNDSTTI